MKRILTNKEYRFIKELKGLMAKYNVVISTDAQGKIEIVVNEDMNRLTLKQKTRSI